MKDPHGTLTPDQVDAAIERALTMIENRWVERGIREAPTDEAAVVVLSQRIGACGWCDSDGLHVASEPGRRRFRAEVWTRVGFAPDTCGFITYAEVVAHVRHGAPGTVSQPALF